MTTPNLLTVFWICSQCGARGQVQVPCPDDTNLEQQLNAIRTAYHQIGHEHTDKLAIGEKPLAPTKTDAGDWIN